MVLSHSTAPYILESGNESWQACSGGGREKGEEFPPPPLSHLSFCCSSYGVFPSFSPLFPSSALSRGRIRRVWGEVDGGGIRQREESYLGKKISSIFCALACPMERDIGESPTLFN